MVYRSLPSITEDSQNWGCGRIYPDYTAPTITIRHEKKADNPLSARCSSVICCAGSSVQFSSYYACLLSPFAYLRTRPSPRSISAVRAALPGLFLVCMYYDGILLLLLQQAASAVISTVSREDSSSIDLKQLVGGS